MAGTEPLPDMPEQTVADKKDTKIMDYSRMTILMKDPKDKSKDPGYTWQTGDATPSRPPWTTWSGILEAPRDSPVGKRILATDPNAIDGETASEDQLKKMHDRPEAAKKKWVRGVWMAPENWKEIEAY